VIINLRFPVADRPGVMARLAGALGDAGVSIEQIVQEGQAADDGGCASAARASSGAPESPGARASAQAGEAAQRCASSAGANPSIIWRPTRGWPIVRPMRMPCSSRPASALAAGAPLALLDVVALGCGGSPTAPARHDVFYLHAGAGIIDHGATREVYFKPLDRAATERVPRIVGVGVLDGNVRLDRPIDWVIRAADSRPKHRFVSYQSPRQFLFSIYERVDGPEETWTDVLQRYEADVDEQGSQILSGRVPVATANTQGRSYLLKTRVPSKPDFQSYRSPTSRATRARS
jgi:ACT domain